MKIKKLKASVLVVSLIIMAIVLLTALSISLTSIRQRNASIGASKSTAAYQNAETGIEKAMNIVTGANSTDTINTLFVSKGFSCSASNNVATILPPASGTYAGYYKIQLRYLASGVDQYVPDCGTTLVGSVDNIKSIGTDVSNQDSRAIEAAVAASSGCTAGKGFGLFVGFTSTKYTGNFGGYPGADSVCATAFPSAVTPHVCNADEMIRSVHCGISFGSGYVYMWDTAGDFTNSGSMTGDCEGFTSGASTVNGISWQEKAGANTWTGPRWIACNSSEPVACCGY